MMSFFDTLPAVLASLDPRIVCRATVGQDGISLGLIIMLPNCWHVSVSDVGNTGCLSMMAFPDFRHSLPFNFNPVFDPDDIQDILTPCQPHEIMRHIRTVLELPPEIASDNPDEDDIFDGNIHLL